MTKMGKKPSSFILYKIHTYSYVICVFLFSFLAVIHITNVKIFICLLLESCFRQPEVDRQHSQLSDTGNRQQATTATEKSQQPGATGHRIGHHIGQKAQPPDPTN